MAKLQISETSLRAADLAYRDSAIGDGGEIDRFDVGAELSLQVMLVPAGSAGFLVVDKLVLASQCGDGICVLDEDGAALPEESLEVILWEKLDAEDFVLDYAEGRMAEPGDAGTTFTRIPKGDPEMEFA